MKLQMLSKRVTRTLITFRRKIKINATENATVPTPLERPHLAAPTSRLPEEWTSA
jgi:hypothetical protein